MPEPEIPLDYFIAGGTLKMSVPSYVKRPADDELFDAILKGDFCYVLTPRQMGKSSLMVRTAYRLKERGVKTVTIDLTSIGVEVSLEQWYIGIINRIKTQLRLSVDLGEWLEENIELGPTQKLTDFFRDILLRQVAGQIVIFVDEIDTTLSLAFSDDFFGAIRSIFNLRASDPECNRLVFVLLGVASPSDLIKDPNRTPFNVGQRIELREFSLQDAGVLQEGLEQLFPGRGEVILSQIFHWTNGHPYLTQRLCSIISELSHLDWDANQVDKLVKSKFGLANVRKEPNLQFVQAQILSHPQQVKLLQLYKTIYKRKKLVVDAHSPLQSELMLSGLVSEVNGYLCVRNNIYRRAFDIGWINRNLPVNKSVIFASLSGLLTIILLSIFLYNSWWLDRQVSAYENVFYQAKNEPSTRLEVLATVFNLHGVLVAQDYDFKALELFYNLPRKEQLAIFQADQDSPDNAVVVVEGIYTTLANVGNTDNSVNLLEEMGNCLKKYDAETANALSSEIGFWISAREHVADENYGKAIEAYSSAIEKNPSNPATLFERAKIYLLSKEYEKAAVDLESVVAIVAQRGGIPTAGVTPTSDTRLRQPVAVSKAQLPTTQTVVETPSAIPEEAAIISEFDTNGKVLSSIRALIDHSPGFKEYLKNVPRTRLPNLANYASFPQKIGLSPTLTAETQVPTRTTTAPWAPTMTATSTPEPTDIPTPTETPIPPTPTPGIGDSQISPIDGMMLLYIPAGEFLRGSEDGYAEGDEWPQRSVYLDAYWVDHTEVTNEMYAKCVSARRCQEPAQNYSSTRTNYYNDPAYGGYPVIHVNWQNAVTYCNWAGRRLPTEAQWEKAARGVTGLLYPWGKKIDCSRANYTGKENACIGDTTAAGSYSNGASPYGALDMAGNVWEWTLDWYNESYYQKSPASNPPGPEQGTSRVIRGGSWFFREGAARPSNREKRDPRGRDVNLGFRCVLLTASSTPPPPQSSVNP